MPTTHKRQHRDKILVFCFLLLTLGLYLTPTGFEERMPARSVRCEALVLEVDNSEVHTFGIVRQGEQTLRLKLLDAPFKGEVVSGMNPLLGMMDKDKLFAPGDRALVVLTLDQKGAITYVNPQDHYRLGTEALLLVLFAALLLVFGGWTGFKALLSFIFAGLCLWKILVPMLLRGYDPVLLSLGVVAVLTGAIVFLVAGLSRLGVVAFLGAFLGVLTSCLLALHFTSALHLHGAVMPFAETMLYSGFAHLDLVGIYVAAVFLAASGAVMDLAMDVAASQQEVVRNSTGLSRKEVFFSGLRVGRAVVGTMTTTLLLAYSGGFVTLLMAFMAQGVPVANLFNMVYVAAEVLKTLVGSFGLVTVAPFTALVGALIFTAPDNKGKQHAVPGQTRE